MREVFGAFLAVGDGFGWWLIYVAAAGFAWRALYLVAECAAITAVEPAPQTSAPTRRRWFPTRVERLNTDIELIRRKTDLIVSQTAESQATAAHKRARAELAALMRELEAAPAEQPQQQQHAALTQSEILNLLHLVSLPEMQRTQLIQLVTRAIEEKVS